MKKQHAHLGASDVAPGPEPPDSDTHGREKSTLCTDEKLNKTKFVYSRIFVRSYLYFQSIMSLQLENGSSISRESCLSHGSPCSTSLNMVKITLFCCICCGSWLVGISSKKKIKGRKIIKDRHLFKETKGLKTKTAYLKIRNQTMPRPMQWM